MLVQPGDWQVQTALKAVAHEISLPLVVRPDRHFYCSLEWFQNYAANRKQLRLEFFYREMRRKHDVLMQDGKPLGGERNYDSQNRQSFGKKGPGLVPLPAAFPPDRITRDVMKLVRERFPNSPGSLDHFDFPVTSEQADMALGDFVANRLPTFGQFQDAMWTAEPYLYHSRLSAAMNLKLLSPRRVVDACQEAYRSGAAPLTAVEGFIRQVLGWREFVRGIYWTGMPAYANENALAAEARLPEFYWTGDTPMRCMSETIEQTLKYGYAHHIQRLMVTGLLRFCLGCGRVRFTNGIWRFTWTPSSGWNCQTYSECLNSQTAAAWRQSPMGPPESTSSE